MEANLKKLKEFITISDNILIISHYNPDGDAIGSSLALYHTLNNLGKNVYVIAPNDFPDNLKWMAGSGNVLLHSKIPKKIQQLVQHAELIFCMDFQALNRTNSMETMLLESNAKKVLIDHHIDPEKGQFDLIFNERTISSTSELLFSILKKIGFIKSFTKEAASCVYAGITTDTGSFSYSCRDSKLFECVAELIDIGVDTVEVHKNIFDTFSESRLRLLGYSLTKRMKVINELQTAYIYLTKKDLKKYNYQIGDTEGIVNFALSMKNVKFAALFTERDTRIRISFRSKGNIDTNDFAKKYFNGGGHKNAAGGNSFQTMKNTITYFETLLPDYVKTF